MRCDASRSDSLARREAARVDWGCQSLRFDRVDFRGTNWSCDDKRATLLIRPRATVVQFSQESLSSSIFDASTSSSPSFLPPLPPFLFFLYPLFLVFLLFIIPLLLLLLLLSLFLLFLLGCLSFVFVFPFFQSVNHLLSSLLLPRWLAASS